MLPLTLICLLQAILGGFAQQQSSTQLSLNNVYDLNTGSLPKPPLFSLPISRSNDLSLSVALCSSNGNSSPPRFFVSNDTSISDPGPSDLGQPNVFELQLNENGFGNWTGLMPDGGYLAVSPGTGQVSFEVGVSDEGLMHEVLGDLPLLGDTTANQVLLFSPPFNEPPTTQPTYPNYTLPQANLSFPQGTSSPPNFTMFIAPTSSSAMVSLPRTGCAMRATSGSGTFNIGPEDSEGLWLKDDQGWRWQWLVNGLTPLTNYTAYAIENRTKISEPIQFVTKSGSFSCPIVHSLPYCPSTAYAVPIAPPSFPATAHDTKTLPNSASDPFFEVLTNFTTSLTTFACGRDEYSPLVSCSDCQQAYRKWLCAIWFPRCSEASATDDAQAPQSALQPQASSTPSRSPGLPPFSSSYNALLPCLETCTAVDRACPNFLGFKCPLPKFTAQASYGVGFVDTGEEGVEGRGSTGTSQDRWGNVWCNQG